MSVEKVEIVEEAVEETVNKPYTLRPLKDGDLFPVLTIIGKVFPDDLGKLFANTMFADEKQKRAEKNGVVIATRLAAAVLKNIDIVREDLYGLLSDLSGIPANEIEEMEFGTTPMMIFDIVEDVKNASFFKVVSKLL
jgi:hypothetical protein